MPRFMIYDSKPATSFQPRLESKKRPGHLPVLPMWGPDFAGMTTERWEHRDD